MFDIGWPELMVVAIVLVVVVGPKDLPRMLRTFGQTTKKLREMAGDFRRQFDDALKEAELDDVKSIVDDARKLDPTAEIKRQLDPMKQAGDQIKAGLDAAMKPGPKAETAPDEPAKTSAPAPAGKSDNTSKATRSATPKKTGKTASARKPAAVRKPTTAKKPAAAKKTAARKPAAKTTADKTTRAAS